jgi:ribonucleoside-diphosphate reductase beta chain
VTNLPGGLMSSILEYRQPYKVNGEFEYPEFFEAYQKALSSVWRPQEVSFESDIRDWQNSTQDEREIIGGILRGFTQLECHVSDYWARIPEWFPKHEVAAVARAFSLSEIVHAEAYNLLSDTLGLDEFEAFLGDPIAQQKIGYFLENRGVKESLAVFSGAGEGVSLFSSFAVLLSLNLTGRYKGIAQIISWSALDEQQHSDTGIKLFRQLIEEDPLTPEEATMISQGFKAVLRNEEAFLDQIFKDRTLGTITLHDAKQYLRWRANERLTKLGASIPLFHVDNEAADRIKSWFHPLMAGATSTDFFAQSKSGDSYIAKPIQDFNGVNLKTLDLVIK